MNKQALLEGLSQIPESWVLTPVNERKAPYRMRWQVEAPLERWFIEEEIREGWAKGYGLRLGEVSVYQGGFLLSVDFDGSSALDKYRELSGGEDPPVTVSWTSGKPGREQRLFNVKVSKGSNFRNRVAFKTGVIGADGKEEQLELRFNHCQSVLPPSVHPETGYYRWINPPFNSGETTLVAAAPKWMVKLLINPANSNSKNGYHTNGNGHQDARSRALCYLEALDHRLADDYDTWIQVGMALHSVGDDGLLEEWDRWSAQSAKYKPGECNKKWRSFNSSGISLGTLAHLAEQSGFPRHDPPKHNHSNLPSQKAEDPPPVPLRERLEELLEKNLDQASRQAVLLDLAAEYGRSLREVERLLEAIETTHEYEEALSETSNRFQELIALESKKLDLHRILPTKIADPMVATAQAMPTTTAALLTTFIPTAGSQIGTSARIVVKASSGYTQPCIFRTALVANTGDRKTPTQRAIVDPLYALESKAFQEWQAKQLAYQQSMENWEPGCGPKPTSPPPRRRYIINDTTIEAKIRIHSENPRGLLDYTDELAGRFTRMNKYRGGHGDDMQQDLTEFNGGEINKDRTKESIFLPRSAISCTGSIQWETLRQLQEQCGADDHAGVWARWLFCVVPMPPPYLNLTGVDADRDTGLGEILEALYHYLGELPEQDYFLTTAAKAKFERWQHKLVNKLQEETIPVLKSAYPKMEAYAARVALLIHIIWAVAEGEKPDQFIPEEMMGRALYLTNFYLSQLRLLVSHNGQDPLTQLEGNLLKIRALLQKAGSITSRDIQRSILRKTPGYQIKEMMRFLAEQGFGVLKGKGLSLKLVTVANDANTEKSVTSVTSVTGVSHRGVTVSQPLKTHQPQGFETSESVSVTLSQGDHVQREKLPQNGNIPLLSL